MKRILCLVSSMNVGGAETFLMKLYRKIDRTEYQMDFCVNIFEDGFYDKEIVKMGGKIYHIPSKTQNLHKFKKQLSELIKSYDYKCVLRITSNALGFMDLKIAKKAGAQVCIARSSNSSDSMGIVSYMAHKIGGLLYSKYVDVKIAPSDLAACYTFGKDAYNHGCVKILRNALDLDLYRFSSEDRINLRQEFGISDDEVLCGHIGRFSKQKNHRFLLDVFFELSKKNSNYKLVLIGIGELEEEVKAQCMRLGLNERVIFAGLRNDIPAVLSAMDLFLFPSLYEGMPNTVIEAQATGLPCIISDRITKEAKITDKVYYLPINGNVEPWAECITQIDTRERVTNNQELKKHGYDIQDVICEFNDIVFEIQ